MQSSTCIVCEGPGYTYHFSGVTAIAHNLALNIGNDVSQGGDIINGAKNIPDQVTLSVVETDVAHSPGWSKKMLEAMASLKRNRYLCRVFTSIGMFKRTGPLAGFAEPERALSFLSSEFGPDPLT